MATTTPNFGWPVPTSTDLVKNGATAIEALGDAIDASMADLEGGTTGQVLAKASNTDMDFAWVAADDTNAIQNSIVDAKGDLIAATANDTPTRLAVGGNTAPLVADSTQSTGLRWDNDIWISYTPALTGSISNPTLGNGTLTGNYKQRGKVIDFRITLVFGSTSTFGSGTYRISLPVTASSAATNTINGNGYTIDASTGTYFHIVADTGDGATVLAFRTLYATVAVPNTYLQTVTSVAPMTFASGDVIQFIGSYEAA